MKISERQYRVKGKFGLAPIEWNRGIKVETVIAQFRVVGIDATVGQC